MLNQVQFIGHLGKDPEVRYMPNGTAVANFSVASTEKWKDKASGEQMESTEWLRCNAFERLAEVCGEYLKKGSLVYVSGQLKTRKYTDKDGIERYATECRLNSMKMLGGRPDADGEQSQQPRARDDAARARATADRPAARPAAKPATKPGTSTGFDDMDDDIPF